MGWLSSVHFGMVVLVLSSCQDLPRSQEPVDESKAEPSVSAPQAALPIQESPADAALPPPEPLFQETRVEPSPVLPVPPPEPEPDPASLLGLLPYDTTWEHASFVNFRPAEGREASVNPPRFSWPYLQAGKPSGPFWHGHAPGVPVSKPASLTEFQFQISADANFADPLVDQRSSWNFANSLKPLPPGTWYWRVGYMTSGESGEPTWSEVRSFVLTPETPTWDRSGFSQAADLIAAKPHPRFGPLDGDWSVMLTRLQGDELGKRWYEGMKRTANSARRQSWWKEGLPETDKFTNAQIKKMKRQERLQFAEMAKQLATASLVYKLSDDARLAKVAELWEQFCRYEKGGLASPEFHGSRIKFTTQIITYLAVGYDCLYHDLTEAQREKMREAIRWRLAAVFEESMTWANRGQGIIHQGGLAIEGSSHPYQNFCWALPGILATLGHEEISERLLPLALDFMAGVGSVEGMEEAYSEGQGYGNEKLWTFLEASAFLQLVYPEFNFAANPWYARQGEWFLQVFRPGLKYWPFGDQHGSDVHLQRTQVQNHHLLWQLTGDTRFAHRLQALRAWRLRRFVPSQPPFADLFLLGRSPGVLEVETNGAAETTAELFPQAGWVAVANTRPSEHEKFSETVGMIFQSRPSGFSGHSYRAENSFMWFGYGEVLSSGGGLRNISSLFARMTMAHNGILINGQGQEYHSYTLPTKYVGRILAYRETPEFIHWVGEATNAYPKVEGVERVLRHVVFVRGKWFAILDDLALKEGTKPATWSWLFKVRPDVPLTINNPTNGLASFSYAIGQAQAQVVLADPNCTLTLRNQPHQEAYQNPHTGKDHLPSDLAQIRQTMKFKNSDHHDRREEAEKGPVAHNLWAENVEASTQQTFLAGLLCWPVDGEGPRVEASHSLALTVSWPGKEPVTVSFDPQLPGTITIDLEPYRQAAQEAAPTLAQSPDTSQTSHDKPFPSSSLTADVHDASLRH